MRERFRSIRLLLEKAKDVRGLLSRPLRSDTTETALSAALMQISEFRYFHLAHKQWFGSSLPDRIMEKIFMSYLLEDTVPYWVRHLTRKVLALHAQGKLDPGDFGIVKPQGSPELMLSGITYTILMAVVLVVFCVLIAGYVPFR